MSDSPNAKAGSPSKNKPNLTLEKLTKSPSTHSDNPGLRKSMSKSKFETISPFLTPRSANSYDRPSSPGKSKALTPRSTNSPGKHKPGASSFFRVQSSATLNENGASPKVTYFVKDLGS